MEQIYCREGFFSNSVLFYNEDNSELLFFIATTLLLFFFFYTRAVLFGTTSARACNITVFHVTFSYFLYHCRVSLAPRDLNCSMGSFHTSFNTASYFFIRVSSNIFFFYKYITRFNKGFFFYLSYHSVFM